MGDSNNTLIYAIPPYLLNTCLGSELQRELTLIDENLGLLNVISPDSPYYYNERPNVKPNNVFSHDPYLNEIIKKKVHYKLALIGALGDNPMSSEKNDTGYLCDLLEQFKDRLMEDSLDKELRKYMPDHSSETVKEEEEEDDDDDEKHDWKQSLGMIVGEIELNSSFFDDLPDSYEEYLRLPLSELIRLTRFNSNHKYKYPQSFIYQNKTTFFNYLLPISWMPLIPPRYLRYLHNNLSLDINNDGGFSTIVLSSGQNQEKLDEGIQKRYFNFITDKPILPSTGIFYYEIEICQEITAATDFKPIIVINDRSVSSDSTSHISTGFCKKIINFESHSTLPNNFTHNQDKLDIEKIRNDILCQEKFCLDELQNQEIETLLTSKPGEFKGSFAVNFEDLNFYNSIKNSQWIQRTTTSMSRKSENGKIDIEVPFKTQIKQDDETRKVYKTDVVGCGINFIDQSVFITLNGVLAKIITREELDSTNPIGDKLFYDSKETGNEISIFPMIGFEINNLTNIKPGDPSTCKIRTNLGFKEFKFNISNYTKTFKNENQKYLSLFDPESKPASGSLNLNSNNKQISLNQLVKGYLNHEGYIDTFKAFTLDLDNLETETKETQMQVTDDSSILNKTHAANRQLIKNYMLNFQFDNLFKFLSMNYPKIMTSARGKRVLYNLKLLQVTYKIRKYIENKLRSESCEFEFELDQKLYIEAFEGCKKLRAEYKDSNKLDQIDGLASTLLISDISQLAKVNSTDALFKDFDRALKAQLSELNNIILQSLGFKNESNLEMIFNNVSKNIKNLSLDYNDDKFMLVNFEKDHMDL